MTGNVLKFDDNFLFLQFEHNMARGNIPNHQYSILNRNTDINGRVGSGKKP